MCQDLQLTGCRFNSRPFYLQVMTVDKHAAVIKQHNLVWKKGANAP